MRKIRRKNRQFKMMVCFLGGCFLTMGVGYSVLTTNLSVQVRAHKIKYDLLIDVVRSRSGLDGLIIDTTTDKNLRYSGPNASVKNYVRFNNETWRIIGVFDGKVKLMHEGMIGSQAWDSKNINNWPTSSLSTYLNGTYYNSISSTYRNMIATHTYDLGGVKRPGTPVAPSKEQAYLEEKGTAKASCTVGTNGETSATCPRATKWTGKIGLPYMSDFGYSMNFCSESDLSLVKDCLNQTWFDTKNGFWLMDHVNGSYLLNWHVVPGVGVFIGAGVLTSTSYGVIPVLYLNPEVVVTSGNGSAATPYQLSL